MMDGPLPGDVALKERSRRPSNLPEIGRKATKTVIPDII
jgi:hypothetical protein